MQGERSKIKLVWFYFWAEAADAIGVKEWKMKNSVNAGSVGIWLDEIVPCLKDTETGEIKETVVFGARSIP